MTWLGWLFLLAVLAVPAMICGILYSDKSGSTPCIGCGECVLVKRRKETLAKKLEKEKKPS